MSETELSSRWNFQLTARGALNAAAQLWFVVAIIGQWIFALYIVGLYGRLTLQGGMPAWANPNVPSGYVPGDDMGNIAAAIHIFLAIIIHGGGPLQLIPQVRNHFPTFHHWNGRVFISAVLATSITGLHLVWVRESEIGLLEAISNTIDAALILFFAAMALRAAIARDIRTHRRWALRLFLVASAVWFVRLGIYQGIYLTRLLDIEFRPIAESFFAFWHVGKLLIPLGILELYLRAQDRGGVRGRLAAAILLFVATIATGLGIYAATTISWLPYH